MLVELTNTVFVNSTNITTNIETAVLSTTASLFWLLTFVFLAMSPHPSNQYSERSHVSTTALQCSDDVEIKRWLTEWQCHLSWTAKKSELFFADDETIACFRSTKTIRIPKKVLFLTLTKERNGYIVRQVAKNKEPSHKGWDLAPQESTYNLKLITAIRGHHSLKIVIFIPYVSSGPVLLIGPENRMP